MIFLNHFQILSLLLLLLHVQVFGSDSSLPDQFQLKRHAESILGVKSTCNAQFLNTSSSDFQLLIQQLRARAALIATELDAKYSDLRANQISDNDSWKQLTDYQWWIATLESYAGRLEELHSQNTGPIIGLE